MRIHSNWISTFVLAVLVAMGSTAKADEGMWLPLLLKDYNYAEMKRLGCKLTPEQIYDINHSSIKDAIVQLGGFCTAEVVSSEGLLFTNHHCAFDAIQSISSLENDYLADGFWATNRADERPIEGLSVSFLVRMEDVTERVQKTTAEITDDLELAKAMLKELSAIEEAASEKGKYRAQVREMFEGNAYYLFVYEVFNDIRLVGAPPESIGKFGGDTDNWMWPRHTGDFSILRIYAGKNNAPAEYNESNVPYKAKHHLPISLKGVQEGDFQMTLGFPGRTSRYLTSYEVSQNLEVTNPIYVKLLGKRLEVMKSNMDANRAVGIKLATSYAQLSNTHKYFQGQTRGLKHNNLAVELKEEEERFQTWANQASQRGEYGFVLSGIKNNQASGRNIEKLSAYLNVAAFAPTFASLGLRSQGLSSVMERNKKDKDSWQMYIQNLNKSLDSYFKNYDEKTDEELFAAMMVMLLRDINANELPDFFSSKLYLKAKGKTVEEKCASVARKIFAKSVLTSREKMEAFLQNPKLKKLQKDPGMQYVNSILAWSRNDIRPKLSELSDELEKLKKAYMKGLMKLNNNKNFYPDANFTLRVTYGSVKSYSSWSGAPYNFMTYASEILEKEDPSNKEFIVPERLRQLIESQDYGRYGHGGKLPVCYINNTDITGGNSGSPVINAEGSLVGIAFDGNWESMTSDLVFEDEFVRTIVVDARYVLFIIDKYAEASYLLDEMTIK